MSAHGEHLARLEEVLYAGDGDARERFEASGLAACAQCRAALEEHAVLAGDLAALSADERAGLRAAEALEAEPARAEEAFRAHVLADLGQDPSDHTGRRGLLVAILAAAAVLVVMAFDLFRPSSDEDGDRVLGDPALLVHPVGTVDAFAPFRWEVELPANGWFVLHVSGEDLELESPRLYGKEWTPPEGPVWPQKIRWTLEVYRGTGQGDLIESYVAWAER